MRLQFNFIILFLVIFTIGGCMYSTEPLGKPLPNLSYDNLTPYVVGGGATQIRQSFIPDKQTIELSKHFPIAPDKLIQRYARKRFLTNGSPVKLDFDIRKASLRKVADADNIVGFLSGAAEDYYKLDILIAMTPIRHDGQKVEPFTIKLHREMFVPQNASLAEREMRQFELLEKAIQQIDMKLSDMVLNHMTPNYF